jgi:hypothetical protein
MKKYFKIILFILTYLFFASCTKQNSDIPNTPGQGNVDTGTKPPATTPPDTSASGVNTPLPVGINYKVSPTITLNGAHDMVISGLAIQNPQGICIHLQNCYNIIIRNCKLGPSKQTGVEVYKCRNITIDSCYMFNISTGLYAEQSSSIQFKYNSVKNVQGPYPKGAMVQYDNVSGTGNRVLYNRCENISGASNPEDAISMYKSNGTADDPILITGNWIRGGGPSKNGGGIMTGDNGGSYIIANDNILVNPGNYGIGIAGGTNIQILNNKIYSSRTTVSNVGVYIWNQSNSGCSLNTISGNLVNWTSLLGEFNNSWNNGNCGAVTGWATNIWGAAITADILPQQLIPDIK